MFGCWAAAREAQQAANAQVYNNGDQAGLAQGKSDSDHNNGYQDRAAEETDLNSFAFNNGFQVGVDEQARNNDDYPY